MSCNSYKDNVSFIIKKPTKPGAFNMHFVQPRKRWNFSLLFCLLRCQCGCSSGGSGHHLQLWLWRCGGDLWNATSKSHTVAPFPVTPSAAGQRSQHSPSSSATLGRTAEVPECCFSLARNISLAFKAARQRNARILFRAWQASFHKGFLHLPDLQ